MTRDEALQMLTLDGGATTDAVEARYRELYSEFQIRLTNAPTPPLKRVYQQRLRELEDARAALIAPAADQQADLPISAPMHAADAEDPDEAVIEGDVAPPPTGGRPHRAFTYVWRVAAGVVGLWLMLRVAASARARTTGASVVKAASIAAIPSGGTSAGGKPEKHAAAAVPATKRGTQGPPPPATPAVPMSDRRVLLAVSGDDSGGAMDALRAVLARGGFEVIAADDAVDGGDGSGSKIDRLRASAARRGARLVALARVSVSPSTAANEFGMSSADAAVEIRVVDATTGEIVASRQSHQTGAGTSAVGAASNAVHRGMELVAPAIASELSARRR